MKSTFDIRELKSHNDMALALVAGVIESKSIYAAFFRMLTSLITLSFQHFEDKKGQCLFLFDELPSVGRLPAIELALPNLRSAGMVFVGITQDIPYLKETYPTGWTKFISNADYVIVMSTNDKETIDYCYERLGQTTIKKYNHHTGVTTRETVDVLSKEQIGRLLDPNSGRMLVFKTGKRPMLLTNEPYFKALPVYSYAPDPEHGDAFIRGITRYFLGRESKKHSQPKLKRPETLQGEETFTSEYSESQEPTNDANAMQGENSEDYFVNHDRHQKGKNDGN